MVHTSCYGRIWKCLKMVEYGKNGNILLYGTYFYFWESLGNCKIFGNFKMGLTDARLFDKIKKNRITCNRCQWEARFLECQKNGKIWRKHSPCKKFPSKNFTRDFLEGSAGIVPPFCIFGKEWIVYKKW